MLLLSVYLRSRYDVPLPTLSDDDVHCALCTPRVLRVCVSCVDLRKPRIQRALLSPRDMRILRTLRAMRLLRSSCPLRALRALRALRLLRSSRTLRILRGRH